MPVCSTRHQSAVKVKSPNCSGTKRGWTTRPKDRVSDSSGCRSGLPERRSAVSLRTWVWLALALSAKLLGMPETVLAPHWLMSVMAPRRSRASQ
ncbi:hypothetical protein D3C72_2184250 [compost metagenome]